MATVGQQLTSPESGWRRYDDTESRLRYIGNWTTSTQANRWNGSCKVSNISGSLIKFSFVGTKIRLLSTIHNSYSNNISIKIDDTNYTFSEYANTATGQYMYVCFEKLNLTNTLHYVEIICNNNNYVELDAIDIDSTGYLVHPTLNQVSDINNMQIGNCIPCRYTATSGIAGYFSELGTCIANEIPIAGTATPDGLFYLIKTDKGTLIADRVIQTNINWDTLNAAKYIDGLSTLYISFLLDITNQSYLIEGGHYGTRNLAFDNTVGPYMSTAWQSLTSDYKGWVGQYFPMPQKIGGYSLAAPNDFAYGPKTWTFEGSNDGVSWDILHMVNNENSWTNGLKRYYQFDNTVSYSYYRINVTNSYAPSGYLIIGEIEMFSNVTQNIKNIIIRSLSGGVAYIDASGNSSLTDKSLGAWPTNNEWDKYIINSDLKGKITKGDDSIWHWSTLCTWCKDTAVNGVVAFSVTATNVSRFVRGFSTISRISFGTSSVVRSDTGFRPVLNYVESDIASEVIY